MIDNALRTQLVSERRFDELLQLQEAEVRAAPDDAELRRQMAWLLAAVSRVPEAVTEAREACRLRPENARYAELLSGYEAKLPAATDSMQSAPDAPSEMADVFRGIYDRNRWLGTESVSGPGSSLAATAVVREALPLVLRALAAETLLDAPCGDFGWLSSVELPVRTYIGIDVVPELIETARERSGGRHEFRVADISRDPVPRADLVLCRDCLVHLSEEGAFAAIANFKESGSEFLLTTTFYAQAQNLPGSTGGWRPINLQRPPFSFSAPILLIPERRFDPARAHSDKSLGLWALASLPGAPSD